MALLNSANDMKNRHFIYLLAATAMAFSACQPESPADLAGGLLLNIENTASAGAKPAVDGISTTWLDGDLITLNGTDCTVTVSGYTAKLTNVTAPRADEHWFATSPAGLVASPEGAGEFWWEERLVANESFQFSYPREYTYTASFQKQMVAFPMVAVAAGSAGSLTFRHLAAAVQVQVETPMLMPIRLDSVVLEATSACLNGDASFTVDASFVPSISAPTSATPASYARRSVRLNCSTPTLVTPGMPLRLQLPVPPLPAGEELTVRVYGTTVSALANYDNTWNMLAIRNQPNRGDVNEFVFSHSDTLASALERTHLINARAEVRPDGHLLDSERSISRLSLFSVSATKKVLFKRDQDATSVSDPYSMPSLGEMQYLMHSRPGARFICVNVNSRMLFGSTPYIIIFPDGYTIDEVRGLEGMDVLNASYFNSHAVQNITTDEVFDISCHDHGFVVLIMGSGSTLAGSNLKYKLEGGYLTPGGGLTDFYPLPSSERSLLVRPIIGY